MISEEKVKIMAVLARYEKNEGVQDAQIYQYSRKDYVRKESLKVGVAISLAYIIAISVAIALNFEMFLGFVQEKHMATVVILLIVMYILLGYGYMKYVGKQANRHYSEVTLRVREYEKKLEELVQVYEQEIEDSRPMIATEESEDGTDIII